MSRRSSAFWGSAVFVSRRVGQAAITPRDTAGIPVGRLDRSRAIIRLKLGRPGQDPARRPDRPRPPQTSSVSWIIRTSERNARGCMQKEGSYTCAVARLRFWHGVGANSSRPVSCGCHWPPGLGLGRSNLTWTTSGLATRATGPGRDGANWATSVWLPSYACKDGWKGARWEKIYKAPREPFIRSFPLILQQQPVSRLC